MTKQEYKALIKRAKADKEVRDWKRYCEAYRRAGEQFDAARVRAK